MVFMIPWGTQWLELDIYDQVLLILGSRRNVDFGEQKDFYIKTLYATNNNWWQHFTCRRSGVCSLNSGVFKMVLVMVCKFHPGMHKTQYNSQ